MNDTIPMRKGEELDVNVIERYIRENIAGLKNEPLVIEQFPTGHSNLTYLLRIGDWEAVLRRPPFGPVAPKAHDMQREAMVLSKVHRAFPYAPKPYAFCNDVSIIGAPFFIMERKRGVVVDKELPPQYPATEETGRKLSEALVRTLVELHQVDYKACGMDEMGKPEGFLKRQVEGWIGRYERAKTEEIKYVDELKQWLMDHIPETKETTIVHNDYKFNNMLFALEDPDRVVAVLDWEMTTIGDPLFDLGCALSYWIEQADPVELRRGIAPITTLPGFITREEFIHLYSLKSGRDMSHIDFYLSFAFFKLAVIVQQIYIRYKMGQTNDERFKHHGEHTKVFIHHAAKIAKL